jgi:tRNA-dihydrouridine synthase
VRGAHLYGSDPVIMAGAAAHAESLNRFDFVDSTRGCPSQDHGARDGAGMLRDLKKWARSSGRSRGHSPAADRKNPHRMNPRQVFADDVARCAEDHGADALFLHTRCASVRHAGPADWDEFGALSRG